MKRLKKALKNTLPSGFVQSLLPLYHLFRGVLANIVYLFPARGMKVIAITGTNGKTTTATYIANILEAAGYKVGVSSTAYYRIGKKEKVNDTNMTVTDPFKIQRMLLKMKFARVDFVVLETTSHALIQKRVWGIPILAAVMTNLTQDHLDYHGTMEKYAAAKAKLFQKNPKVIVLNRDDEWFEYYDAFEASEDKISYGANKDSDVQIGEVAVSPTGTVFTLTIDKNNVLPVKTHLIGRFNAYNAAAAAATTYALHVEREAIAKGLDTLESVPGRMEAIDEGQPFGVIVDYAHTPDALRNVLETVKALTPNRTILVFGATGDRDKAKRPDMGEIAATIADRVVLTDEEPYSEDPDTIRKDVFKGIKKAKGEARTKEVADRREAIREAFSIARKGDVVIIAGMGHQRYMTVASGKIPWDDRDVARELLQEKTKKS